MCKTLSDQEIMDKIQEEKDKHDFLKDCARFFICPNCGHQPVRVHCSKNKKPSYKKGVTTINWESNTMFECNNCRRKMAARLEIE